MHSKMGKVWLRAGYMTPASFLKSPEADESPSPWPGQNGGRKEPSSVPTAKQTVKLETKFYKPEIHFSHF